MDACEVKLDDHPKWLYAQKDTHMSCAFLALQTCDIDKMDEMATSLFRV